MAFPATPVHNTVYTVYGVKYIYRFVGGKGTYIALRRA